MEPYSLNRIIAIVFPLEEENISIWVIFSQKIAYFLKGNKTLTL